MKKSNGFVLAELTIAIAIFALCVTIVLGYVSRGVEFSGKSRDMSRAMNIAKLELAKIENIPFPPTTATSTQSNFTEGEGVDKTSDDDSEFKIKVTPTDMGEDSAGNAVFKKIELSVYKNVDTASSTVTSNDKRMVTLYTYIARNGLY